MEDLTRHMADRFPGRESQIRELARTSSRFQKLAAQHLEVDRRLRAIDPAALPGRYQQLESDLQRLEDEINAVLAGA